MILPLHFIPSKFIKALNLKTMCEHIFTLLRQEGVNRHICEGIRGRRCWDSLELFVGLFVCQSGYGTDGWFTRKATTSFQTGFGALRVSCSV
jgi:hypothetical protein